MPKPLRESPPCSLVFFLVSSSPSRSSFLRPANCFTLHLHPRRFCILFIDVARSLLKHIRNTFLFREEKNFHHQARQKEVFISCIYFFRTVNVYRANVLYFLASFLNCVALFQEISLCDADVDIDTMMLLLTAIMIEKCNCVQSELHTTERNKRNKSHTKALFRRCGI